ncbi:MAG: hypothetical protein N3F66_03790 [Spirochaetes bacterium]|nr:hypothetical protein [Spirochaetota bacterium]
MSLKKIIVSIIVIITLYSIVIGNTGRYNLIKNNILTICEWENAGATSTLIDSKDATRYEPNKIFDGDIKTAWAEGDKGPGIGVKVVFEIPTPGYSTNLSNGAKIMNIVNGLAYSKQLFYSNNRIKDLTLEYYVGVDIGEEENNCSRYVLYLYDTKSYTLKDTMDKQSLNLNINFEKAKNFWKQSRDIARKKGYKVFEGDYGRYLFGVLTIKSIYKGTKYDDTCISEISFE